MVPYRSSAEEGHRLLTGAVHAELESVVEDPGSAAAATMSIDKTTGDGPYEPKKSGT